MYVIIWRYRINPSARADFESAYSATGTWVRLFRQASGFLGTELLHATQQVDRYVTIDRWAGKQDYDAFRTRFADDYARLDQEFAAFTVDETMVGTFEADGPG